MAAVLTVLVQYFICVCGTILVARANSHSKIVYLNKGGNISCSDLSKIKINSVTVFHGNFSLCHQTDCILNDKDLHAIHTICHNSTTCRLDLNWTTSCLMDYGKINITYTCDTCGESTNYECNFETKFCHWKMFNWNRSSGGNNMQFKIDHTTGEDYGHYIYIDSNGENENKANLTSGQMLPNKTKCLSFWYQVKAQGKVNLYLNVTQTEGTNYFIYNWTLDRTNNKWLYTDVEFISDKKYTIAIDSRVTNNAIGLDDIDIFDGICQDSRKINYNFENDLCSWISTGNVTWPSLKAEGSPLPAIEDHTTETKNGHYMRVNPYSVAGEARIVSATITPTVPSCVSFWYYIHGEPIESFNVYQNDTNVASLNISLKDTWYQHLLNISASAPYRISFSAKFTQYYGIPVDRCVIIDDVTITNGSCPCEKEVRFAHKCLYMDESVNLKCQTKELLNDSIEIMLQYQNLTYNPRECDTRKKVIEEKITNFCWEKFYNQSCTFRPFDFFDDENGCFVVKDTKQLLVNYSCTDSHISSTTVSTTLGLSITPTAVDTGTDVPDSAAKSSNATGIIVGVVFGVAFIVGLGAFLFWFIRRSKSVRKKSASHDNQILSTDYTGHQSIALPDLPNLLSNNDGYTEIQTTNDNYQHIKSHLNTSIDTSGRNYAKLKKLKNLSDNKARNSSDANCPTGHDYIYFDETDTGSTQTSIHVPGLNMTNNDIQKSNEYAVIDPNNDHSNGTENNITRSSTSPGNYVILDPNETGFCRSKGNNETTTNYEFAASVNDNERVSYLQDQYTVSENGTYDSTNKVRHKNAETNIYSHAVENVYDTSTHERKIVENEGTYDHFFADETEDNYNITKRE